MLADLHIYGGLGFLAGGIGWATGAPGLAIAIFGAGLIALGVTYAMREQQQTDEAEKLAEKPEPATRRRAA